MRLVALALLATLLSIPGMAATRRAGKRSSHRTHAVAKSVRSKRAVSAKRSTKSTRHRNSGRTRAIKVRPQ